MKLRWTDIACLILIIVMAIFALAMALENDQALARPAHWSNWQRVAGCETRGVEHRWSYGPRHPYARRHGWNGYYGGLQWKPSTWTSDQAHMPKRVRYRLASARRAGVAGADPHAGGDS